MSQNEILEEIGRISAQHTIAAHCLGKKRYDIEVEAAYTKNILKFLEHGKYKLSIVVIMKQIIAEDNKTKYLSEIDDVYETSGEPEVNENILQKCKILREIIGEQIYEQCLQYYNSVAQAKYKYKDRNEAYKRELESRAMWKKKRKILQKIAQSPELQSIFA